MCPDSGATTDIISERVAKQARIEIKPNKEEWTITNAQGKPVEILGIGTVRLARPGGQWQVHTLVVCLKLSDNMLLSWKMQKWLGILQARWLWLYYSQKARVNLNYFLWRQR